MKYIYIGKINGTHGLKGELKLKSNFIYKDKVLKNDFIFYIGEEKQKVVLNSCRNHNGTYLVAFKNYLDINLVENFRNQKLYISKDDLLLQEDEYVFEDYIGLDCYFDDKYLGKITNIIECGPANYIFVIGDEEVLIPLNKKFIDKIIKNDKIIFKEVEGIIDAN